MLAIKGVLLDIDGTLVDTNDAHARAWVTAFQENGYDVPYEKVRPLIGMGGDQLLPRVVGVEKDSEAGKKLSDAWSNIFQEQYLPGAQPFPQAGELLNELHRRGLRLVTTSSGEQEVADVLLEKVGVQDILAGQTSSASAQKSKPAPDIVQAGLKQIGLPAPEVLLLGDSPYDIQSALPLGVGVVALRCGGSSDADLIGAVAIYDDPTDLLTNFDTSPFYAPASVSS